MGFSGFVVVTDY